MNYYLQAAMARERHNMLLADAEAFRLAAPGRFHRSTARDTVRSTGRRRARWQLVTRAVPSTETPT